MNGAELIAHILKLEDVEILPAFPHSDLIEAASKVGIRPVIVRQERHALHMADGYTRVTGGNKLCCTTVQYGPGSENAMGGIAQCFADNVPVLHIPGGYSRDTQSVTPNFSATKNMKSITKWCEMVQQASRIPQMMQNAFALLRNGRPGPVVLEVPHDIFTEEVNPSLVEEYKPQHHSAPAANQNEISRLVDVLLESNTPVIIAGQGILYAGATEELVMLAERTRTPVISTLNGKSAFPENHPLALGCAGLSQSDTVINFLNKADLILGIGTSFTRSEYITPFPIEGRFYAQVTNWEGDISKDYPIDLGVIGDAKPTIVAINHEVQSRLGVKTLRDYDVIVKDILTIKQAFLKQWLPLLESNKRPINPYRVIWDLMNMVDRTKTIVTHEAGSPRDQTVPFYEAIVPHGYIGWGKTTQLGTSLGLIQGAKLSKPDYTCVNIMGDAAIGMVGMDFETAARNQIGTTTIVLKNSVMGDYTSYHPAAAKKFGIHKLGGNYADIAVALGGYGEQVVEPENLKSAFGRAFTENAKGVPALIEVISSEESRKAITPQPKN